MSILIDAKGLSCPEPVLLAQEALKDHSGKAFTIEVSSATAKDNVAELLQKQGRTFEVNDKGDYFEFQVQA